MMVLLFNGYLLCLQVDPFKDPTPAPCGVGQSHRMVQSFAVNYGWATKKWQTSNPRTLNPTDWEKESMKEGPTMGLDRVVLLHIH